VNEFLAAVRHDGFDAVPARFFYAYARHLGVDIEKQSQLLWIAKFAAVAPLLAGWTEQKDARGCWFYYDVQRRNSSWTHPFEEEHREVLSRVKTLIQKGTASGDVRLGGLRRQLWQVQTDLAEAEQEWAEHRDQEGRRFFFNRRERSTSWSDPRLVLQHRLQLVHRAVVCVLSCGKADDHEMDIEIDRPSWIEQLVKSGCEKEAWSVPGLFSTDSGAECPVCYDTLCASQPSVLISDDGHRVCSHYFCFSCARRLQTGCPLCRAQAAAGSRCKALPLPDIEKQPLLWFSLVDVDGDGRLNQAEAVRAVETTLPLDAECFRSALSGSNLQSDVLLRKSKCSPPRGDYVDRWHAWELDGVKSEDRSIGASAFCSQGGMLEWVVAHVCRLRDVSEAKDTPDLHPDSAEQWFDLNNVDADGSMTQHIFAEHC
jgi:hypothetical protein